MMRVSICCQDSIIRVPPKIPLRQDPAVPQVCPILSVQPRALAGDKSQVGMLQPLPAATRQHRGFRDSNRSDAPSTSKLGSALP